MRRGSLLVVALCSLACGGLLGPPDKVEVEGRIDEGDAAEQMRLKGDYAGAEADLRRRLQANPQDARAWRLLGDVNFTRGQYYQQKWKDNLLWAWEAYTGAIAIDPTSCLTWGRLAFVAAAAAENPQTAISREALDELPFEDGWTHCGGSTMLDLEFRREPTEAERSAARRGQSADAPEATLLAAAAPWMPAAVQKATLTNVQWQEVLPRPPVAPGGWFVVFPGDKPIIGGSIDGSKPRSFTYPEWITVGSANNTRITFLDRRYPERVPAVALTRAPGCPGTRWELRGADRVPVGNCVPGPQDSRASEIYDGTRLQPAGKAHFHQPSIAGATIGWDTVAEGSVSCLGGPVGRMFVDTPSCQVAYDRAIPQRRWIPAENTGVAALTREHAQLMVEAARSQDLFGAEIASHLSRGRIGLGMPYAFVGWSQPDLTGCKGRGIYQKARIQEGAIEFECVIGTTTIDFREMTVISAKVGQQ
ncbi:MAG: hypothetical protein KC621_34360 [Myxococcales bacterium]|nr:hypothetical protein [Myxococcales bacterium]